jgi:hypothetical protein
VVDAVDDPGMLFAYSVPWLGRLLARRGDPVAEGMLTAAWEQAQRQRLLLGLAYAGIARVEWAWLAGEPGVAERVGAVLLARTEHPGAAPFRGELLPPPRPWASSRICAPSRRRPACASACGRWARASRAARVR